MDREAVMADEYLADINRQTDGQTKTSSGKPGRPKKGRGASTSSDASDDRWTIRGIPKNVRGIAAKAAEKRGMTVGDWISEAVVRYSKADTPEVSADTKAGVPATQQEDYFKLVFEALERTDKRLTAIESDQRRTFFGRLFGRG